MDLQNNWKVAEAKREAVSENPENEILPAYEAEDSTPNISPPSSSGTLGPTVSSPFNFPGTDLPPYTPSIANQRPIAIPQRWPDPSAPFLTAYAPSLLNYGIPANTFHSFLDTLSAFLTATVSKRAISHAGDIAASVGRVPKNLGKDLVAQAKDTGRGIASSAKQGNPFGVVGGVIGGTIGMTVGVAFRTIGSIFQLPAAAAIAAANPKTPRGRAELYLATANRDWFGPRGLNARLLDSVELANLLGIATAGFLIAAGPAVSAGNTGEKLMALRRWIDDLQVPESESLQGDGQKTTDSPSTFEDAKMAPDTRNPAPDPAESSLSAGKRPVQEQAKSLPPGSLRLGPPTLWFVLLPVDISPETGKLGKQKR